ncbi:universal stress protein [Parasphingopyxis algicola]|uniref:universal stress protein n=1 Tax=Parasphingopyxis algicola TaxID=2026624 RepID=UPI0015A40D71|nr:universal stress protein [Parasphingopyxis algicola]QLC25355.1 universal stress protein [Parasphingopyxis algicola]
MKTILLHVDDDAGLDSRLEAALTVVRLLDGHLTCSQPSTVANLVGERYPVANWDDGGVVGDIVHAAAQQADALEDRIEARLDGEGISWSWRRCALGAVQALVEESVLADLIVVSAPDEDHHPEIARAFVGEVALSAGAPVFTVPTGFENFDPAGPVMVAWDGSIEATRTVRSSIALLKRAAAVHLVTVGTSMRRGFDVAQSKAYFDLLGLAVDVAAIEKQGRTTDSLIAKASDIGATYIVMGAYGHSRLREAVFGGVTRAMLGQDRFPLLMHH